MTSAASVPHIFVSYSSTDRLRVLPIADAIEHAGISVWIDRKGIPAGVSYGPEIVAAIRDCGALFLLCSQAAFESRNVRQEIQLAWRFERPVLPLLLEPVSVPDDLAYWLEGAQWIELYDLPREDWLSRIVRSLTRLGLDANALVQPVSEDPGASSTVSSNLPVSAASFIGRTVESGDIRELLTSTRLLTLIGTGGSGKTRLAIEVARSLLAHHPGGVWLVELATALSPDNIEQYVAQAIGAREETDVAPIETIGQKLLTDPALLVLDNCEHLLEGCGLFVEALLLRCPNLKILATSREPLHVSGEVAYRVPVLRLPDLESPVTAATVADSDAVKLFMARASVARPGFELTDSNAADIARICRRLDGIPLALELAAARIKLLDPAGLAGRLDDRFKLLTSNASTSLPRHQTLRGLIDWSYELLTEAEAMVFARLAVFTGGWTLEAAEAVCGNQSGSTDDILDIMELLVDKSLANTDASSSGFRFSMLETLRQYAQERLTDSGESEIVRERHAAFFKAMTGGDNPPKVPGDEMASWLSRIQDDFENLRSVLAWSVDHDPLTGLVVANNLGRFWYIRSHFAEGLDWYARLLPQLEHADGPHMSDAHTCASMLYRGQGEMGIALDHVIKAESFARNGGDEQRLARVLYYHGAILQARGESDEAITKLEDGLKIARDSDLRELTGSILNVLGDAYYSKGDHLRAIATVEEGLLLKRLANDAIGIGVCLLTLGALTLSRKEHERAESCFSEALVLFRSLGDRENVAIALLNLGAVSVDQGFDPRAAALCIEAMVAFRELGDRSGTAFCLELLAALAIRNDHAERGVHWLGSAESIRHEINEPIPVEQMDDHTVLIKNARVQLGDEIFRKVWSRGERLPIEVAIEDALTFAEMTSWDVEFKSPVG